MLISQALRAPRSVKFGLEFDELIGQLLGREHRGGYTGLFRNKEEKNNNMMGRVS